MSFDFAACDTHMEGMTPEELASNLKLACEYCAELEAEGKRALEHIDDQAAIIRDLREKLADSEKRNVDLRKCIEKHAEEVFSRASGCPVSEICRNPGKCPECIEESLADLQLARAGKGGVVLQVVRT